MKIFTTILLLFILLFHISCVDNTITNDALKEAETNLASKPDSSLNILESLDIDKLDKKQKSNYYLIKIIAKDLLNLDISSDTILFTFCDDMKNEGDIENRMKYLYYSGKINMKLKRFDIAMKYFHDAEKVSENSQDHIIKGQIQGSIGIILLDQFYRKEAEGKFIKALENFQKANFIEGEITTNLLIGNYHFYENNIDSAFLYYNNGLKLARSIKDSTRSAKIEQNIGVLHYNNGNFNKAQVHLLKAIELLDNSIEKAKVFLNLGELYYNTEQNDSASYYLLKSLYLQDSIVDLPLKMKTYEFLTKVSENKDDFRFAYLYQKKYTEVLDEIYSKEIDKTILESEKKYNFEKIQNKNISLEAKQKEYIIYSILTFLCAVSIIFIYTIKYSHKKRETISAAKEILEAHNQILQLKELAKSYDENKKTFRDILLHQFDILKKVAFLDKLLRGEDKQGKILLKAFNEIVYKQDSLNWNLLYRTMNSLHNGFFDKIKLDYLQLDESEFKICCLVYEKFSSSEIAIILKTSIHSIHMKTTSIRKKLGIQSFGSIPDFFDNRYQ